jgi:hypothetical protein
MFYKRQKLTRNIDIHDRYRARPNFLLLAVIATGSLVSTSQRLNTRRQR